MPFRERGGDDPADEHGLGHSLATATMSSAIASANGSANVVSMTRIASMVGASTRMVSVLRSMAGRARIWAVTSEGWDLRFGALPRVGGGAPACRSRGAGTRPRGSRTLRPTSTRSRPAGLRAGAARRARRRPRRAPACPRPGRPACRSAADHTASSPARTPVCERMAACASGFRPAL
jgi:hypothetical protein